MLQVVLPPSQSSLGAVLDVDKIRGRRCREQPLFAG